MQRTLPEIPSHRLPGLCIVGILDGHEMDRIAPKVHQRLTSRRWGDLDNFPLHLAHVQRLVS